MIDRRKFLKYIGLAPAVVGVSKILAQSVSKPIILSYVPNTIGWYEHAKPGYDYVIGVYAGDHINQSIVSVWRMGTINEPIVQAAEYPVKYDGLYEDLLNVCIFLSTKYGEYLPNGPLFSIEQVTAHGDTLQHLLKLKGYRRFYRMARNGCAEKQIDGWYSNSWSRPLMIDRILTGYREDWITVKSPLLRRDIDGVTFTPIAGKKRLSIPNAYGDHRFMAAAIAVSSAYSMRKQAERRKEHKNMERRG